MMITSVDMRTIINIISMQFMRGINDVSFSDSFGIISMKVFWVSALKTLISRDLVHSPNVLSSP